MLRVLFIEDNGTVRLLVTHTMPQVEWVQCDTIAAGVAAARREEFDAVLLDLGLPDALDGSSLNHLGELRSITQKPIVVLSGSDDAGDIRRAIEAGANAYLTKRLLPQAVIQVFITLYVTVLKGTL